MKLFICGAVPDILREFQAKLERIGHEVVGAQEYRPSRPYNPPVETEAVIVGTDQSGHAATDSIITTCKARGLPYALGELRKWSLIYPRMVQAGIVSDQVPIAEQEEEMTREGETGGTRREAIREKVQELVELLREDEVDTAELHFANKRYKFEALFKPPTLTMEE